MSTGWEEAAEPGAEAQEEERYRAVLEVALEQGGAATELSAWLKDPSWRVRKVAAQRLAQVPDRAEALEVLLMALGERGHPGVRNAAAEALSRMGPWALGPVAGLLRHPDPDQRKFAAEILGQLGLVQAEPSLLPLLEDPDPNVRAAVAESLGRVGGHPSVLALQRLLLKEEPLLQLCALDALTALEAPPPLHQVVALLDHPVLRKAAYRLVALCAEAPAAEVVGRGLRAQAPAAREAALGALGELWQRWPPPRRGELEALLRPYVRGLPDCEALVEQALEEQEEGVRRGAVFLVALMEGPRPLGRVARAAGDPALAPVAAELLSRVGGAAGKALLAQLPSLSIQARSVVCEALLGSVEAGWVAPLLALLETGDPELHLFAVRALGRTGAADAVAPVVDALGQPALGHAAARALARLGVTHRPEACRLLAARVEEAPSAPAILAYARLAGPEAAPALQRLRHGAEAALRAASVEGAVDTGEGEEPLRLALSDEAAVVRAAAARALGRLPAPVAEPLLRLGLGDPDPEVRMAAFEAAAEAGCRGAVPQLEAGAQDPEGRVAAHAIRALGRLGALGAALLWAAARHADPEVVKEVLAGAASTPQGEPLALSLLGHARWDVRAAAARALGTAGSSVSVGQVRAALATEADPLVRHALAETARVLARR